MLYSVNILNLLWFGIANAAIILLYVGGAICFHTKKMDITKKKLKQKKQQHQKQKLKSLLVEKNKLIKKGAVAVMTAEEFKKLPYNNKGHNCEYWLHQTYNLGNYKPDHERFDKCGDVEINGIQYQVKFENASLTNVNTLHNAQKDARVKR